jgi:hypothetical protein
MRRTEGEQRSSGRPSAGWTLRQLWEERIQIWIATAISSAVIVGFVAWTMIGLARARGDQCRDLYALARTAADTARVDLYRFGSAKSTPEDCGTLRRQHMLRERR